MEDVGTTILSERHCRLGEGPTFDPATGTAWWFDILERMLFEADIGSGEIASHTLPFMGSVLAVIDERRQLLASDDGLYVRDSADGRLTLHTPLEADDAMTRSNDGASIPAARSGSEPWAAARKRAPAPSITFIAANCAGFMPGSHPERDLLLARRRNGLFHR